MDIRQFTPQTQRTLARMDFNQDNKLSARELDLLKNQPQVAGIAPKDLAVIQEALKKTKGPEQIIVTLVDDNLPPGYKAPAPIYAEPKAKPEPKPAGAARQSEATKPEATRPEGKKRDGKAPQIEAPVTFKATPKMTEAKKNQPSGPKDPDQVPHGMDLQTTANLGALKLQGTTSVAEEGKKFAGKVSAAIQAAPNLGVQIGFDASSPEGEEPKAKAAPAKAGSKPSAKKAAPVSAPTDTALPQNLSLNGKIDAGPLKLTGKGKLDTETSRVKDITTGAELKVIDGHAVKVESKSTLSKDNSLTLGAVKLGSSHKLTEGLSVTTSTQLDPTGKPKKYGGGFSYEHGNGLSLEADLLAKADTSFSRPAKAMQDLDVNVGFRYKRTF